jgi:hypothetical protein
VLSVSSVNKVEQHPPSTTSYVLAHPLYPNPFQYCGTVRKWVLYAQLSSPRSHVRRWYTMGPRRGRCHPQKPRAYPRRRLRLINDPTDKRVNGETRFVTCRRSMCAKVDAAMRRRRHYDQRLKLKERVGVAFCGKQFIGTQTTVATSLLRESQCTGTNIPLRPPALITIPEPSAICPSLRNDQWRDGDYLYSLARHPLRSGNGLSHIIFKMLVCCPRLSTMMGR